MKYKAHKWLTVAVIAACIGCSNTETGDNSASQGEQPVASDQGANQPNETSTKPAAAEEPTPPPTIPKVILPESLAATCLVKAGDPMPQGQLLDLEGNGKPIQGFFAKKLTVVFFWNARSMYAQGALEHLSKEVAGPFEEKGVGVVTVNEGDTPQAILQMIDTLPTPLPSLLDPDGQYFAKVAKDRPLRPYLLDSQGKILWFDIEYSESTRRDLIQSIRVALGEI